MAGPERIAVDGEVWDLIRANAEPFVDEPNDVLRRLLGLDRGGAAAVPRRRETGRAAPGSILPETEYEGPILQELLARGGSAHATEITDAVGERLRDRLTDADLGRTASGDVRWRGRVQFARLGLRKRGLVASGSPRGVWELTDAGRKAAEAAA